MASKKVEWKKAKRVWANSDPEWTGSLAWAISLDGSTISASFELRDCSRRAALDFHSFRGEDKTKLLRKAAKLRRMATEFESALQKAFAEQTVAK
jgi:uncharacterized membrane protein